MKAITSSPVHVEGLGDVVVLPPCDFDIDHWPCQQAPTAGDVLAEVEFFCSLCSHAYAVLGLRLQHADHIDIKTEVMGYRPPHRWWEVAEVLPVRIDYTTAEVAAIVVMGPWMMSAGEVSYVPGDGTRSTPLTFPTPPEPGGVVLVVSETTCPWCKGWLSADRNPHDYCRCTRPPSMTGDGPIVEVAFDG